MANQKPIGKYKIRQEVPIDIRFYRVSADFVPDFEVLEAATEGHYNLTQFWEVSDYERAVCVARYRMHNRIDSVVNQEVQDYTRHNRPRL